MSRQYRIKQTGDNIFRIQYKDGWWSSWHDLTMSYSTLEAARQVAKALDRQANEYPKYYGLGEGGGKLFVYGDYDSIKAAQAIIFGPGR